jgi:hypothetical protein
MNPTARSKQYLEKQGFIVCKVEQRVKFPIPGKEVQGNYLKDAFGFGDLLFMGNGVIGLCQSTSGGNKASRVQKILGLSETKEWLKCGGKILVHGWAKRGPRGGRKLWSAGEAQISLASDNSLESVNLDVCRKDQGKAEPFNTCLKTPGTCESCPHYTDPKPVVGSFGFPQGSGRSRETAGSGGTGLSSLKEGA